MSKMTLWDFQKEDLQTLGEADFTGLLAIEAGGGKTVTAVASIAESEASRTLLISPDSTHKTAWIPTVTDFLGVVPKIIGNRNKETKNNLFDFELGYPGIYLATPQFVTRSDVSAWSGDMIIVDEIHSAGATPKSKLQRALSGYDPSDGQPLAARFDMHLALSGTPLRQNFENAWGITKFLWGRSLFRRGQVAYDNFVGWQYERMDYEEVVTGVHWWETNWEAYKNPPREGLWKKVIDGVPHFGEPKKAKKFLTEKEPGRLFSEMPCVIQHKRRTACCDHHPNGFLPTEKPQVIERRVTLTPTQKRTIREMDNLMMTYIQDDPLTAEISLTQKQRIRQLAMAEATVEEYEEETEDGPVLKNRVTYSPNAKSPAVEEIIHILRNLPDEEAVLIFTESQKFAEVIVHQVNSAGIQAEEYSGKSKADLSKFGEDYRVLVGVVAAIGTGTAGLNAKSSTEIYADQPISLTMFEQSSARLDRIDNTRRVQRFVILDDEGIAEGRMEDLWSKKLMVAKSTTVR